MNSKLPRLVLVGVGTIAVAVLSAFSAKNPGVSSSGASLDDAGYEVACGGFGERPCNPPASAVRG